VVFFSNCSLKIFTHFAAQNKGKKGFGDKIKESLRQELYNTPLSVAQAVYFDAHSAFIEQNIHGKIWWIESACELLLLLLLQILVEHEERQTPVVGLEQPLQVVCVSGEGSDGARLLAQKVILQEG
jgi:hypothetical protein